MNDTRSKDISENISVSPRPAGELDQGLRENTKLTFSVEKSNKSRLRGKLHYWWCWFAASALLLFVGAPAVLFLWIINQRLRLYPLALWGAETWLIACGARVKVIGSENLEPDRTYVFASNHRSYLDTAALFRYTGKRIGLVAKKELLKVPVLGQGMGFVNIIAIDRSNPERALASMEKAREVMHAGYSFGVFVEGTRALPGELLPFKKGAFHLAMQTDAPIIPVAIRNSDWMMGKKTGVAYPGEIEMILLPAIETNGRDVMDVLRETRAAVAAELGREE
ncbi:MAG TPA: lysophospholipid acyltransferase family protein [Pyrinomonadaceae bacterium]|nr:lysophospholipid acyltransferase family protein [Pyrinomonadaceae bacterium]